MISRFNPEHHVFRSSTLQQIITDVLAFVAATPVQPLPPGEAFQGSGAYLLYYTGSFPLYAAIAQRNHRELNTPIYAGKAVPRGWRQARTTTQPSKALYRRLKEHTASIKAAENLETADFQCRFVILEGDESSLIATVEAELIQQYQPLWNTVVDGFGNHDPGVNRYGQLLADWDTLHPGRSWEKKWIGPRPDYNDLVEAIQTDFG